jgi:Flp pilus assembly protein TadD
MRHDRTAGIAMALLVFIATLTYSNHFENTFHFDDSHAVVANAYIRSLSNFKLFFTDVRTFSSLPANRSYRPLVTSSLALDYALAGGYKPAYFQASTFFWFLVQLVVMYALFRKICDMARPDPRNQWISFFAAALYAVHPAIAETVNYIIQRGDVYSTLGVVAALTTYVLLPGYRKFGLYLIPLVLGLLSKPPAMIFPVILLTYVLLFEETRFLPALKRCVPAVLVVALLGFVASTLTPVTGIESGYAYRVTQPLVALRYFRTFFIPNHLTADSDFDELSSIFEPAALLGFVFVALVVAAALWCSRLQKWRPTAFGLWWFLLALFPTAIFPLNEVENDHRMYFPFVGLVLAATWTVALWLCGWSPGHRIRTGAIMGTGVLVLVVATMATRGRNEVWRTDESLWYDVTLKSPHNGRGLMNYGLTQMEKGDYQGALDYFERAAVFTPEYPNLEINLGIANGGLNHDAVAEEHFQRAAELAPDFADSHYFYARWLNERKRTSEAIAELEQAIAMNPDYLPAQYLIMEAYSEQADWPRLRRAAENTLHRFPGDATAANSLARANSSASGGKAQ